MAKSFSFVLDQTKRPAPGWRCNSASMEFGMCVRCWEDFAHEWKKLGFPMVEIVEAQTPLPPLDPSLPAEERA